MRNMFKVIGASLLGLFLLGCEKVPSGYVGVKVYQYGSEKGVDTEVLPVGRHTYNPWSQDIYLFPTFIQTDTYTSENSQQINVQTSEGLTVGMNISTQYRVDPEKVSQLFQSYRMGIEEISNSVIRKYIQDALVEQSSKYKVEDLYGQGKVAVINDAALIIKERASQQGIIIEAVNLVGQLELPDNVKSAINAKIQAIQDAQKVENQVAQAKAEADKKIEEARGRAESVMLERKAEAEGIRMVGDARASAIEMEGEALRKNNGLVALRYVEKWNGQEPMFKMGGTGGSGTGAILNIDASVISAVQRQQAASANTQDDDEPTNKRAK